MCRRNSRGTCNCGFMVQAGDDVIRIDKCPKTPFVAWEDIPLEKYIYARGALTSGVHVYSNGLAFKVC